MIEIRHATKGELGVIRDLAPIVWRHAYSGVLSEQQIQYMLSQIYSLEALEAQFSSGQRFVFIRENHFTLGFLGYKGINESGVLRIEKLYVHPDYQGRRLGAKLISFVEELARENNLYVLELNVNRSNKALHFYQKQGFTIVDTVDIPYGPFILDDYVMQKNISIQD